VARILAIAVKSSVEPPPWSHIRQYSWRSHAGSFNPVGVGGGSTSAESAVSRFGQMADSGTHSVVRFAVVPLSGEMRERKHFALPMFNIREKFESVKSRRREFIPCGPSPALAVVRVLEM
jgi:hypothetical protein